MRGFLKRDVAALLLVVFWLFLQPAAAQPSEEQLEQHFRAGRQALQEGQFARAAEQFKQVLALDPSLVEAEVNLGLAYQGLLEYDLAVRHLTKALKERPNLPGPALIAGLDYTKLGAAEKAIPLLEQSIKFDASNRYAREALASCYLNRENFRNAAGQFRQIAALNTDKAEAWFKLGHQYLDLAARLAYRGARLYPESAWGHRFLGDLLFQRNRWEDAVTEYGKALNGDPRQPGLHTSLGQTWLHAQKPEKTETEFRLELQLDRRSELAWMGLASLWLARKQAKEALESLDEVWRISPEFLALQRDFPSVEVSPELVKAAISDLAGAPELPARHYLLAVLSAAAGDTSQADREWTIFLNRMPAWQKAPAQSGRDPCTAHRYPRCVESLKARTSLTYPERLLLGRAQYFLQQYEAAAMTLEQMPEAARENAEASYWLERTYQALGAEAYARLEESFQGSWRTHQLRAEGHALRGNVDQAIKEFQAALEVRPDEPELYDGLGEIYLDSHNYDAAQHELEKALALDGSRVHTLYLIGRVCVETRENKAAVPYLERALRLQPDLAEANSLLGTAYLRLGQVAEAVPKLEKAAPSDHYGNVHYQLFVAYKKLGKPELAQKELERSQDLRRKALERDQAVVMGAANPDADGR